MTTRRVRHAKNGGGAGPAQGGRTGSPRTGDRQPCTRTLRTGELADRYGNP